MVDIDLLKSKLKSLSEYIQDLEEVKEVSLEEIKADKKLRRYIERTLQLAIECCLDTGSHVISDLGLREPANNRDVFIVLAEHGFIEKARQETFEKMTGFRNIIIHEYARIEPAIIHAVLQNGIEDLRYFASEMKQFIP